jgi:hypothetical protein
MVTEFRAPPIEWKGRDDGFLHHALFRNGRNFPISILAIAVEGSLFYLINNLYVGLIWGPMIRFVSDYNVTHTYTSLPRSTPYGSRLAASWPHCGSFPSS